MSWLVLTRRDSPPVRGQILVLNDSPIQSIAELKDQEVGFPGPEVFVAYKVPFAQPRSRNMLVRVVFGSNMDSALA